MLDGEILDHFQEIIFDENDEEFLILMIFFSEGRYLNLLWIFVI
jgi:hypothetical protein